MRVPQDHDESVALRCGHVVMWNKGDSMSSMTAIISHFGEVHGISADTIGKLVAAAHSNTLDPDVNRQFLAEYREVEPEHYDVQMSRFSARKYSLRAASYLRVSSGDEQDIMENQRKRIRDYARERNFDLVREFEEVGSGGDVRRPTLGELMREASRKVGRPFDLVIFQSLSRMTRGGIESALFILRELERFGCGWHFVDLPSLNYDERTPGLAKDILLAVIAAVDKDYRRRISSATKAAYNRRRALAEARGDKVRWGRRRKGPLPSRTSKTENPGPDENSPYSPPG